MPTPKTTPATRPITRLDLFAAHALQGLLQSEAFLDYTHATPVPVQRYTGEIAVTEIAAQLAKDLDKKLPRK